MNTIRTTTAAVALLAGLALSGAALANGQGQGGGVAVSGTNTNAAEAGASNAGNNQAITFQGSQASDIPNNTPNVVAPALTTTLTETCMGSTSAGASVAGFGATFGTTWRDEECVRRLNARELRAMGLGPVAMELMCDNDDIRAAFERAGRRVEDLPQCQRTVDERAVLAGGAPAGAPYTITTRTADPFNNATKHTDGADDSSASSTDTDEDPWAHTRGSDN